MTSSVGSTRGAKAAIGERAAAQQISYRVPDLADDTVRPEYAGKHIVIAGSGHSALTAIITFAELAAQHPGTKLTWAVRRGVTDDVFGGGQSDELAARGALGMRAKKAVDDGYLNVVSGFRTDTTVTWDVPADEPVGRYRIVYYGDSRALDGTLTPFTGYSREFDLR